VIRFRAYVPELHSLRTRRGFYFFQWNVDGAVAVPDRVDEPPVFADNLDQLCQQLKVRKSLVLAWDRVVVHGQEKMDAAIPVHCQCGEWSGGPCPWEGPRSETVEVEFTGPGGSRRLRVHDECAGAMTREDGDRVRVLESEPRENLDPALAGRGGSL